MVLLLDCHLRALDGEEEGEGEGEGHEHEGEEDDHLVEHLPRVPACVLQPAPRPVLYPGHGGPPPGPAPAPALLLQLEHDRGLRDFLLPVLVIIHQLLHSQNQ